MSFISLLLDWYDVHKRTMPWRGQNDVYHIWLSEIILQQTRVSQGIAYYEKFVENYPTVNHLAKAPEQDVLNLWQGLGYYSRARNLHKTAKIIQQEFDGIFPTEYKELKKLPGIGPYTAAAIASIVYDQRVPAIDGNAYRVYSRLYAIDKDISDSNAHKFFFDFVLDKMPQVRAGDYNQAIMELGATICLPKNPICHQCPVASYCTAYSTGTIDRFPVKTKKVKVKKRYFHYFFIHNNHQEFIIKQRTAKDVWLNLNDFPLVETKSPNLTDSPIPINELKLMADYKHILTHQRIFIKLYEIQVDSDRLKKLNDTFNGRIVSPNQILEIPFPKPIFSFLHERYPDYI